MRPGLYTPPTCQLCTLECLPHRHCRTDAPRLHLLVRHNRCQPPSHTSSSGTGHHKLPRSGPDRFQRHLRMPFDTVASHHFRSCRSPRLSARRNLRLPGCHRIRGRRAARCKTPNYRPRKTPLRPRILSCMAESYRRYIHHSPHRRRHCNYCLVRPHKFLAQSVGGMGATLHFGRLGCLHRAQNMLEFHHRYTCSRSMSVYTPSIWAVCIALTSTDTKSRGRTDNTFDATRVRAIVFVTARTDPLADTAHLCSPSLRHSRPW